MKKRFNYKEALKEHKVGRELVGIVLRLGGGSREYKKLYQIIKFKRK
jgi:hypothetical protein